MKLIAHSLKKPFFHMVVITIMGIVVYSNTLYSPFMFDDAVNIVENPIIKDFEHFKDNAKVYNSTALSGIKDFFGTRYIGYLSFAINYRLHGLDVFGYHAVNIVIHIMNAMLVYCLIALSFRTPFLKSNMPESDSEQGNNGGNAGIIALFISLVFVAHPIQTQAVTYIVQRFTSMATLFYLSCFVLYIQSRLVESKFRRYSFYIASVMSAVLAMKTKEIAFTLPVMIMLYEFMFFEGKVKKRLFYLIPIILTMLIIPLTLITNNSLESKNIEAAFNIANFQNILSRSEYLFTQFRVIVTYMMLMFPPVVQNLDYDYPVYHSFFDVNVILSFLFLSSLFGLGIYLLRRSSRLNMQNNRILRLSAFGIFWFFIALSVESSIIPINDVIFEHRLYLPSVGFITTVVVCAGIIRGRLLHRGMILGRTVVPIAVAMLLILSGATYARNTVWQDEIKLWEDVVKKSPNKVIPHNNLGAAYLEKGRIDEGTRELEIALQINPDMQEAHNNLGTVYLKQGHFNEAVEKFLFVLKRNPYYFKAHNKIGVAYLELNRFDDAIRSFKNAIKLNPDYADAYYNLGIVYEKLGKPEEALKEYKIAVGLKPDLIVMRNNLGVNYYKKGKFDDAIRIYQTIIKLRPDMVQAHYNLGLAYKAQRRFDEAVREFEIAYRLKPDDKIKKSMESINDELKGKS